MDACPPAPCVLPRGTAAQSHGPLVWGGASFGGTRCVRAEVAEGLPVAVLRGGRTSSASAPGMRGETEAQREQGCAQGHTVGPGQLAQAGSAPQTVPSLRPGPTPPHGCLSVGALPGEVENSHPG